MSKWLIEYYPIAPAQHLEVHNLDVLKCQDYCSKSYQDDVKAKLDYFNFAVTRHGIDNNMTHYNNSTLEIVEADTVKDALKIFFGLSETVTEFADRCRECGAKYGKLLKQKTDVLDAIRAEIKDIAFDWQEIDGEHESFMVVDLNEALNIIDKYKTESEE